MYILGKVRVLEAKNNIAQENVWLLARAITRVSVRPTTKSRPVFQCTTNWVKLHNIFNFQIEYTDRFRCIANQLQGVLKQKKKKNIEFIRGLQFRNRLRHIINMNIFMFPTRVYDQIQRDHIVSLFCRRRHNRFEWNMTIVPTF